MRVLVYKEPLIDKRPIVDNFEVIEISKSEQCLGLHVISIVSATRKEFNSKLWMDITTRIFCRLGGQQGLNILIEDAL